MDDSPPVRFALAVLVALIVWFVFLVQLGHWLSPSPSARAADKPIEMRMMELDPPKAPVETPSAAPAAHAPLAPATPRQATDPRTHVSTQSRTPPSVPPKPDARPVQSVAPAPSAPAVQESKPSAEPSAHTAASPDENTTPSAKSSGDAAAHSISQPLPELPDDLREQAYQTVATARFAIHVDGSVDVELVKPTPSPRLNQILLETLRKWRFFPAMQAGRPVESRQDIRVHFNVS
ncbi:energy transducer TonB [Paraburkholderia fungorum]|uniref:energy transducer TonB n=1 Tax=Paraburkholderia fungorum TaxID=134537 RepID=UPI00217E5CEA|nr:energy transducer TonB [Paraburkholderia fungorum]